MPCHAAMDDKSLIINQQTLVEDALKSMDKQALNYAILVNDDGGYEGIFSRRYLLRGLLPVSVQVDGGALVDLSAAPGIVQRLKKVKPLPVLNFIDRTPKTVTPQMPLWEGISLLVANHNDPLVVLDEHTQKPLGLMYDSTVLIELERLQNDDVA